MVIGDDPRSRDRGEPQRHDDMACSSSVGRAGRAAGSPLFERTGQQRPRHRYNTLMSESEHNSSNDDTSDPQTVGDAKERIEGLEQRIDTLETVGGATEHADALRNERDELQERVEATRSKSTAEAAAEAALRTLAEGDAGSSGESLAARELSESDRETVESLAARADTFDTIDEVHADALRADAADVAGVEEFGTVESDIL